MNKVQLQNNHFQKLTEKMLKEFNSDVDFQHKYVLNHKGQKQVNANMALDNQYIMNTLLKQIPNDDVAITVENALINSGISKKETLVHNLEKQINDLHFIKSSKNKIKKAKKAIKRLYATRNNLIGDRATEWFMTPTGKNIKAVKTVQVKNFLEELDECLGATLTPCEQLAVQSQKEYSQH